MERNIGKSSSADRPKNEKMWSSNANDKSDESTKKIKKKNIVKEINSWDCSSPSSSEKVAKTKNNDWDSTSDCQETMVEPFDNNNNKEYDNWDSESDQQSIPNFIKIATINQSSSEPTSDSFPSLPVINKVNERKKDTSRDIFDVPDIPKGKKLTLDDGIIDIKTNRTDEDLLLIEDVEEFLKNDGSQKSGGPEEIISVVTSIEQNTGSEKMESLGEVTQEESTVWMIPKSERSRSLCTNSKLISVSEKDKLKTLDKLMVIKRAKSYSDMEKGKNKKRLTRTARSDGLRRIEIEKANISNFFTNEGTSIKKKIDCSNIKKEMPKNENFDRDRVFYTEYECRAMTMDTDKSTPESRSFYSSTEEVFSESGNSNINQIMVNDDNIRTNHDGPNEGAVPGLNTNPVISTTSPSLTSTPNNVMGRNTCMRRQNNEVFNEIAMAGPSTLTSLDVVSLPDIFGKSSFNGIRCGKDKTVRRINSSGKGRNSQDPKSPSAPIKRANESWFLLDETGQYQAVTRDEVTILLNGRSADSVLQGKKEHVIPNTNLTNATSPRGSLSNVLNKESLQYFLREEDIGGEGQGKKCIDLERKVENTLLYIQPGTNLTASIRIIPVDTDMIHLWRRTKDNGSLLSSEVDLRLHSPEESIENTHQRISADYQSSYARRVSIGMERPQQTVTEQDENQNQCSETQGNENSNISDRQDNNQPNDYSRLLVETRMIVDTLTNNFKSLQTRLDGETNRSLALQGEVYKLRQLLKEVGGKSAIEKKSRGRMSEQRIIAAEVPSSISPLSVRLPDAIDSRTETGSIVYKDPANRSSVEMRQDLATCREAYEESDGKTQSDSGCITVNIYTVEDKISSVSGVSGCGMARVQGTNSLLQTNLAIIDGKMKRLQHENKVITKQNLELKEKLNEISLELDKYIASTSNQDHKQDDRESDTLRDQVCNLKLELDNLKKTSTYQQEELRIENNMIREELMKNLVTLEEIFIKTNHVYREIENSKIKLGESGIYLNLDNMPRDPENFLTVFNLYVQQTTESLLKITNAKTSEVYKSSIEISSSNNDSESYKLDHTLTGHNKLITDSHGECNNRMAEDYFSVMIEKASLTEEMNILKTENEMLIQGQAEHFEKLKETMIALKDMRGEISILECNHKLAEEEKNKMIEMLKMLEDEKRSLEKKLGEKNKIIEKLEIEKKGRDTDVRDNFDKLKAAGDEIKNLGLTCKIKDETVEKLKLENERLEKIQAKKDDQMELLRNEIKALEQRNIKLESELQSSKLYMNESRKENLEYISRLETLVNTTQENFEKNKQKLKESNLLVSRWKNEHDVKEKQRQCDQKLYQKTKEELDAIKDRLDKMTELEEDNARLYKQIELITNSEREKSQMLDTAAREYKMLLHENTALNEKLEMLSQDKDESLKEQKDLINKYSLLTREVQKLQEKYKNMKIECNERTDVIKYLENMLKENILEYNGRIASLEKNINRLLDKIAACKSNMKEKNLGVETEVRDLRRQLDVTCRERKELEHVVSKYYTVVKRLETEVQEREKKVDELHRKLSHEQQKILEAEKPERATSTSREIQKKEEEILKIDSLDKEISADDSDSTECRKQIQNETSRLNEKKRLELTIADLKSELNKYKIRSEIMMKNITKSNKNLNGLNVDKRALEESTKRTQELNKEIDEKNKKILDLNALLHKYRVDLRMKESDLENTKKKNLAKENELKSLQSQLFKLQDCLAATNKNSEMQQKERNELSEKLMQSLKLLMEERSTRQATELLAAEKEKNLKEQVEHLKNDLVQKAKDCSQLGCKLEMKKKFTSKLQGDFKKVKSELQSLRSQRSPLFDGTENSGLTSTNRQSSLEKCSPKRNMNVSPERLESYMKELKDIRELNLQLRKTEGECQAKIVRLEDEIRGAKLLVKELQGDIKTEKKSKKAFENMILSARAEIERCVVAKQLITSVAERINRYLDLSEIPSRELLSEFRISDNVSSLTNTYR